MMVKSRMMVLKTVRKFLNDPRWARSRGSRRRLAPSGAPIEHFPVGHAVTVTRGAARLHPRHTSLHVGPHRRQLQERGKLRDSREMKKSHLLAGVAASWALAVS